MGNLLNYEMNCPKDHAITLGLTDKDHRWNCLDEKCKSINFPSNKKCFKCTKERPEKPEFYLYDPSKDEKKEEDPKLQPMGKPKPSHKDAGLQKTNDPKLYKCGVCEK